MSAAQLRSTEPILSGINVCRPCTDSQQSLPGIVSKLWGDSRLLEAKQAGCRSGCFSACSTRSGTLPLPSGIWQGQCRPGAAAAAGPEGCSRGSLHMPHHLLWQHIMSAYDICIQICTHLTKQASTIIKQSALTYKYRICICTGCFHPPTLLCSMCTCTAFTKYMSSKTCHENQLK